MKYRYVTHENCKYEILMFSVLSPTTSLCCQCKCWFRWRGGGRCFWEWCSQSIHSIK